MYNQTNKQQKGKQRHDIESKQNSVEQIFFKKKKRQRCIQAVWKGDRVCFTIQNVMIS